MPVSDADLQELFASENTLALVFWKDACAPCVQLDRVLKSISSELPASVEIRSAAVHENPQLVETFSVSSVPTLVIIENGAEVDRVTGVERPQKLKRILEREGALS